MSFQPYNEDEKLYFTSSLPKLGTGLYSPAGLKKLGDRLYELRVGDFAYPVLLPVPHVEMTLFELDPACVTISLFRTVRRRTMPVRGMDHVYAVGGVNVVDWEAPFGVDCTYWAEQYDGEGNFLATTPQTTTRLDVFDTWVHNPLDPAGAVRVKLGRGSAAKIPRPQDADIAYFDGSGIATAVTGQRHGVTDTPIVFNTLTDADTEKVNAMLGDPYSGPSGPMILCIRPGANEDTHWPKPFFALVALEEQLVNQQVGKQVTRWEGTGTEVEPPAVVLVSAVLTYDDLDAYYGTYEAMDAAYGTYLERDRAYSLAGYADANPDGNPGTGGGESGPTNPVPPTSGDTNAGYGEGPYGAGNYGS